MGNKSTHKRFNENHEPWSLQFFLRIGVLVPGPMDEETTIMLRAVNNNAFSKRVPKANHYHEKCKCARGASLIIPNDWQDYTLLFQMRVSSIGRDLNLDWFRVALLYCLFNFDEEKTLASCSKLANSPVKHQSDIPWCFMNKYLDEFAQLPVFTEHVVIDDDMLELC